MKKIFKKVLSCIAVAAMVTSSLPTVAFAGGAEQQSSDSGISVQASTELDNAKSALRSFNYSNPTSEYGSFAEDKTGDFASGTTYTTYMRNVLYGEKSTNDNQGSITTKDVSALVKYPQMVLLYDGQNDLDIPVIACAYASDNKGNRYVYAAINNTEGLTFVNNNVWYGSAQACNWVGMYSKSSSNDIGQIGSTVATGKAARIANKATIGGWKKIWYDWSNMFRFNGSFNSGEYTKSITPTVIFYTGSDTTVKTTDIVNVCNATKKLYFVNYKSLLDEIQNAKTFIDSVSYDKYTEASVNAYANAVTALTSFNPTSLSFSASSLESDVSNAGTTIKNLIDNYNTAKNGLEIIKYNYTFVKKDRTSQVFKAQNYSAALMGANAQFGNTETTAKSYKGVSDGVNQHHYYTYSWPVEIENEKQDCTVEEVETENIENCTVGTDGLCTVCQHKILEYSAYDSAVKKAETIKADEQYTQASRTAYGEAVEAAKITKSSQTTQDEIDAAVRSILSAETLLRKQSNTVTVEMMADDSTEPKTIEDKTKSVEYGTEYTIDLKSEIGDNSVQKWIVTTDDGSTTTAINTTDKKITLVVTKDVKVTVYTVKKPTDETKKYSKVVFLGKNGRVVDVKYVAEGEEIDTNNTVSVPTIPFYSSNGWDKATVTGTGSDIYVRANYSSSLDENHCVVHYLNEDKSEYSQQQYDYDSYAKVPDEVEGTYFALASDAKGENILTYLEGREFYVPYVTDIYVVPVESREAKAAITGSFKEDITDEDGVAKKKAVFNCKFYVPDDCTVIEWGAEVTYNSKTITIKSENLSKGNEYSVYVKTKSTTIKSFTGVAYVTYKDANEKLHTVRSTDDGSEGVTVDIN